MPQITVFTTEYWLAKNLCHTTSKVPRTSGGRTTTVLWPFVWDCPGEPVPEETFTDPPS